jgi:hypothetical protein
MTGRSIRLQLASGPVAVAPALAAHALVPLGDPGYRIAERTVSELSEIGAPTRRVWTIQGTIGALLTAAFGLGVRAAERDERRLRRAGALVTVQALLSIFWPPMHPRGTRFTLTDTLHLVWTAATVALLLTAMALSAAALGPRFRAFSIAMLAILLATGVATSLDAPRVAANLPTP